MAGSLTISRKLPEFLAFFAVVLPAMAVAQDASYEFGGHVKTRLLADSFPSDSVFNSLTGSSAVDLESNLRLNFNASKGSWDFDSAWQLFAGYGDRIELSQSLPPELQIFAGRLPNDDRRLFNLTSVIEEDGKFAALHRIDRISIGYTGRKSVVRFGRQAITWGNGLVFSPLDIVNPFDPTAVDTEYKAGDDMLYGQFLRDNGHDVQAAIVFRRDPFTGDPESDQATTAIKYHGLAGASEYDLLVADHYDELTLGVGGNISIGGAVARGDVVVTDSSDGTTAQVVANLSYSWIWGGKNVSGVIEYYFNGFGISGGEYDSQALAQNPDLVARLARGELFTIGRNYLAGGLMIELTPLWITTGNFFFNADDASALLQFVSTHNLAENLEFIGAINVPVGPAGSEFGGIELQMPGEYASTDLSLFAQLAWYF